jgi:hypothetical protein
VKLVVRLPCPTALPTAHTGGYGPCVRRDDPVSERDAGVGHPAAARIIFQHGHPPAARNARALQPAVRMVGIEIFEEHFVA